MTIFGLIAMAGLAQAQMLHVKADVPFGFTAGGRQLDAGTYSIQRKLGESSEVLVLRNHETGQSINLAANRAEKLHPATESKLVFHRYGNDYFLSEVWVQGSDSGERFVASNRERELAKTQHPGELPVMAQAK
jgi:hypothetical protein